MSLLIGLPESSGRRVKLFLTGIIITTIFTHIRPGMSNRPVMAAVLRRQPHLIIISQSINQSTVGFFLLIHATNAWNMKKTLEERI
jgi:hypothetical protein